MSWKIVLSWNLFNGFVRFSIGANWWRSSGFVSRSNRVCVNIVVLCVDSVKFALIQLFCLWTVEIALVWCVVCDGGLGCEIGKYFHFTPHQWPMPEIIFSKHSRECNQTSENKTFSLRKFCIIKHFATKQMEFKIFVFSIICVWQRGWKHEMIENKLLLCTYFKSINMGKSGVVLYFYSQCHLLTFFLPKFEEKKWWVWVKNFIHPNSFPLIFHSNQTI